MIEPIFKLSDKRFSHLENFDFINNPEDMITRINMLIDLIDVKDTAINAFLGETVIPDCLDDQIALLAELGGQNNFSPKNYPLFGLTVGVKDIFNVDDFPACCGSLLPASQFEGPESEAVTALKKAGAIVLGKTVTTEFAFSDSGPTANPHNLAHTPGGSSSGSCAAVAAGFCDIALGTQTIGSIIRPASYCGIYGIKPSYNRVSTKGVLPFSPGVDHIGVFSLSINLIEKAMTAMASDWCTLRPVSDPAELRAIIIPEGPYLDRADADMLNELAIAEQKLIEAGFTVKRVKCFDDFDSIEKIHRLLIAKEFYDVHQPRLERYGHLYRPGTKFLIEKGRVVSDYDLQKALQGRFEFAFECANILYEQDAIMFMTPSSVGRADKGLESTGDPIMNLPWTYAGMPAFNVPVNLEAKDARKDNLPAGIQFVAPRGMDEELVSYIPLISSFI